MQKKTKSLKKFVPRGCEVPKWYGLCYESIETNSFVCYPIGLNNLMRLFRFIHFALAYPFPNLRDRFESSAFFKGYLKGKEDTERSYKEMFETEVSKRLKESREKESRARGKGL